MFFGQKGFTMWYTVTYGSFQGKMFVCLFVSVPWKESCTGRGQIWRTRKMSKIGVKFTKNQWKVEKNVTLNEQSHSLIKHICKGMLQYMPIMSIQEKLRQEVSDFEISLGCYSRCASKAVGDNHTSLWLSLRDILVADFTGCTKPTVVSFNSIIRGRNKQHKVENKLHWCW